MVSLSDMLKASAGLVTEEAEGDLSSIFIEEPVSLDTFIQDKKFLGNPPLSVVQYEAVRHIERIFYPNLYPLMAKEFGGEYWTNPCRMTNFITLQWGKGCKLGNSDIYDAATGQWVKLKDWKGGLVAAADENGHISAWEASESWVSGRGPSYRVTLTSGLVDEVYIGHRYLRRDSIDQRGSRAPRKYYSSWQPLGELKVGDYIATANTVPEPVAPISQDPREIELIGLLLGDGCLPSTSKRRYSVALTVRNGESETRNRFENLVRSFGCKIRASSNDHRTNLYATGNAGRGSNYVLNLVLSWGLDGCEAYTKHVPEDLFSLPKEQVALLLSRLWDTDGHVYVPASGAVPEASYCTASQQLAVDIQRLLLRLGCRAQIQHKKVPYNGEVRIYYVVRMRDRTNVGLFCSQVSLLDKEPQRLAAIAACSAGNGKFRARKGDLHWDKIVSIEYIGEQDYYDLEVPGPQNYVSNGTLNHNSGKDHICRVASMRVAYLLLCLTSPQRYYGIPEQDTIHLLNVASSSTQAQQAFFTPITRAVKHGWFEDRCDPKLNTISYEKNIECISGHSDAETQEGLNLILGIADEIDAFKSKSEIVVRRTRSAREPTKSAEGILEMLRTSGSTRFPETFKNVRISYPRFLGSMIQTLTSDAKKDITKKKDASRHYVSGPLATWEVNPRVKGKEVFSDDYDTDPVMAKAKYECRPSHAVNPYFRNKLAVEATFEKVAAPITVSYERDGDAWLPSYKFHKDFKPIIGAIYAVHADLAITGDKAGLSMAHVVKYNDYEKIIAGKDGEDVPFQDRRPVVKTDFVIAYEADNNLNPPREIQIRWARHLVFELIQKGFTIKLVTYDGFQCLSGDTEIPLLNGTTRKMSELAGSDPFWVYSIKDGRVVPGLCTKAWKTGTRDDMVEVELDNGETVRATSDHLFMLRDGSYEQAGKLLPGDSLMTLVDEKFKRLYNHKVVAVRSALPEDVYDLQVEEHHNFAVAAGVFVHNSADSIQILKARGIASKRVSTDITSDPWRNLRDLMYEGRLKAPVNEDLIDELLSLTQLMNGKIDHPSNSSKDMADAFACAVVGAISIGGEEDPQQRESHYENATFEVGPALQMTGIPKDMQGGAPRSFDSEPVFWQGFGV